MPNALERKLGPAKTFHPSKKAAVEEAREASVLALSVHHDLGAHGCS